MRMKSDEEILGQLKTLYPALSPGELVIAKENIDRYLLLAWEIYENLEREGESTLTPFRSGSSMQGKVDSHTN